MCVCQGQGSNLMLYSSRARSFDDERAAAGASVWAEGESVGFLLCARLLTILCVMNALAVGVSRLGGGG